MLNQPLLVHGPGQIKFFGNVIIGVVRSPYNMSSYAYFEVRSKNSKIVIEDGVWLNNNSCIISEGEGVRIGRNTLIGLNFTAYDSDFHNLDPSLRVVGLPNTAPVVIGNNVFIGSNVTILKGVIVGDNSVIGSGSVVTKSIPENVIAVGNPCKPLRGL